MKQPDPRPPKLNPFVLPSQTTVLFAIIVGVFLAAILSGAIGPSPICITPILAGIVLLPLRAYLGWPDREIERFKLRPADESCTPLRDTLANLSEEIGLRSSPRLLTTNQPISIYTFGSFRRRYVAVNVDMARALMADLASPENTLRARALLLHELYHFRSGDVWQMGYARELLHTVAVFLSWSAAFFIGWILLIVVNLPVILRPDLFDLVPELVPGFRAQIESLMGLDAAVRAQMAQRASQINFGLVASYALNSLLPVIGVGIVVWAFYWRKLLRVRELYADAGAALVLGDVSAVQRALAHYGMGLPSRISTSSALFPLPELQARPTPDTPLAFGGETWDALRRLHPRLVERVQCLQDPDRVLGSWQNVALVVGILALLLDVLLTSPFTLYYISDWPMHFSTLAAFVAIAVWLLPNVAQGKRLVGDVVRVVVVIIGLRAVWLAINLAVAAVLYLVSPQLLVELFEVVIRTSSRSAAVSAGRVVQDAGQVLLGAGIGQASFLVAMSVCLVSFLLADIWFKRRVFTWYGFHRIVLVCWGITLTFALFLGTVVLIPLTALIMGRPETLFSPMSLLLIVVAVLMTGIGLLAFVQADRRYGRCCPKCGAGVPGNFELGKKCQKCQGELHPWLNASY